MCSPGCRGVPSSELSCTLKPRPCGQQRAAFSRELAWLPGSRLPQTHVPQVSHGPAEHLLQGRRLLGQPNRWGDAKGLIKSLLPTVIIKVQKGVCFSKEEKNLSDNNL